MIENQDLLNNISRNIDKELLKILNNPDSFNDRKTKIILENNYSYIIEKINKTKDDEFINFLNYINEAKIPLLKILVNGYIDFNFENEKENIILGIISNIINIYFGKNIFYFIYKKLSKYYRRHDKLKDIQSIKKFEKLFKVWKLLYNIEKNLPNINKSINDKDSFSEISLDLDNEDQNNIKNMKKAEKDLNEIEYFGGFESFIPLFKIINYIINNLGNNEKEKIEKQNNDNLIINDKDYIKESIIWIKDILKIIIKLICLSENNYTKFKNIIVPLIGALSEIYHTLNNDIIQRDYKALLLNDEIIYLFLFLIVNSKVPKNIINIYQKIFEINNYWENKFCMDYILFDLNKIKIIDLYWYFLLLFNFITYILLYFDSTKKIQKKYFEYINLYIDSESLIDDINFKKGVKPFINFIENISSKKNENIIKNSESMTLFNENKYYFKFFINLINVVLNVKLLKIKESDIKDKKIFSIIDSLLKSCNFDIKKESNNYNEIKNNFIYYYNEYNFINHIFPFIKKENIIKFKDFLNYLMSELIDFHGQYHHLIKELFVFNRLWSNQKLFYTHTIDKRKESNLKYKNINYYTRNFQRPVIYPILDYKYRYPNFSKFKIEKDFYNIPESEDDYNFDLDCPELDEILKQYIEKTLNYITENKDIKKYNVCQIKQEYHIKGKLFVINTKKECKIYFYTGFNDQIENLKCINSKKDEKKKKKKNENNNVCYGSLFKCSEKEKNKIIKIDFKEIRMFLSRIYYYRKSAIEIFTETKSYYFNFNSEEDLNDLIGIFDNYCEYLYYPININDNSGYIKLKSGIIQNLIKNNNKFIDFIFDNNLGKMCVFDIIILINLISNRSYIDLQQYPVFPLLFFCDNESNIIQRDFTNHLGLQEVDQVSKEKAETIISSYKGSLEVGLNNGEIQYFNTHYSNDVYTSNFMMRLFPYSFCAIQLQGDGFDDPNRLVFSIKDTFYNILSQKSDTRELIPEFFYLPEMFINLNSINFKKRSNGDLVDDVNMSINIDSNNIININNKINEQNNVINKNNNNQKNLLFFFFVDYMKKKLEDLEGKCLASWLNLIFGEEQRYKKGSQMEQYFRKEGYIDIDKETYEKYIEDTIILDSIDFGLIPLQTINKINKNNYFKKRENIYEKLDASTEDKLNNNLKEINQKSIINNKNNQIKENLKDKEKNSIYEYKEYKLDNFNYWDEELNIDFKIENFDNFGKLNVYKNGKLINEIIDHNDKINYIFYNRRLNMFATTSFDGLACIYLLPGKLISIIKNPNNLYFDEIFLSANPFPTIIAFEKKNNIIYSYSLSGILINKKTFKINNIKIVPIFEIYGGAFRDRIKILNDKYEILKIYNVPFFEEYKSTQNNK